MLLNSFMQIHQALSRARFCRAGQLATSDTCRFFTPSVHLRPQHDEREAARRAGPSATAGTSLHLSESRRIHEVVHIRPRYCAY